MITKLVAVGSGIGAQANTAADNAKPGAAPDAEPPEEQAQKEQEAAVVCFCNIPARGSQADEFF